MRRRKKTRPGSLPRQVRVGRKTLRVHRRRMAKLFGITYPAHRQGKITVDAGLRGLPALSTLVHEMMHHLRWDLSESRVQHLEYALVSMVLANPDVFSSLASHSPHAR